MPPIDFRFDHLHIVCFDLETMIDFWTTALGGKLVTKRMFGSASGAVIDMDGVAIYLRLPKTGEDVTSAKKTSIGYNHVGLITDHLPVAVKRLIDYGCSVASDNVTGTTVFLHGPENILLEIKTKT